MIYEFACDKCFKRGVVTTWEMEFKLDEPKISFCAKCGGEGKQVILTPPMLGSAKRRDYAHADRMLESAYHEQTGRDPGSKPEPPREDPELLRSTGMDSMRAYWGKPQDVLNQSKMSGAGGPAAEMKFDKPQTSIAHVSKDDAVSRERILAENREST